MGYIVRGPLAGMTWHHIQYVLGLRALGHEVTYYEDSGRTEYCCYNPNTGITGSDPSYGLSYLKDFLSALNLELDWAYYDCNRDRWLGNKDRSRFELGEYDLLINLSSSNPMKDWMMKIPARILIDTDPAFTQIRNLQDPARRALTESHTALFTFGENINLPGCRIPADGFAWMTTRQPVCLELWPNHSDRHQRFTNVMQWESYPSLDYDGMRFGTKADSFEDYLGLPKRTSQLMEVALGSSSAPRERFRENNWILTDPLDISRDPWVYQRYIQNSRAEFSVAKSAYVKSASGWFSERDASYLASGRPVLAQDTGFTSWLETGEGILAFSSPEEALRGIDDINGHYKKHCTRAREIAAEYFRDQTVLSSLLEKAFEKR